MMEKYKSIIKHNSKKLVTYEFFYVLLVSLVTIPTVMYLYNLIFKKQTISLICIFSLSLLLILSLLLLLFIKTNLITILDKSNHNKEIKLKEIFKISLSKFPDLFSTKNFLLILLYLVYLPFLYIDIVSYYIIRYTQYIGVDPNLLISLGTIYFVAIFFLSNYLYTWHYAIIEDKTFKVAQSNSKKIIKGNLLKSLGNLLLVQLLMLPIIIIIALIYNQLILPNSLFTSNAIICSFNWLISILILTVYISLINVVISSMFYANKKEKKERVKQIKYVKTSKLKLILKPIAFIYIVFATLVSMNYIYNEFSIGKELKRNIEITAHRGASNYYPENTMLAFIGAKQENADWIELDVRETKDNQIVVFHDDNLSRITGVNKKVGDLTYDELIKLDYGSFFDKKYSKAKIPLLSETIRFAKNNNIKLNIELKPTGLEENFEGEVVALIEEYDFADSCVISTSSYKRIRNIKRLDPNIKTVYLAYVINDDLACLEDADAISVNILNMSSYLVNLIHNAGKEVYVWTINDEKVIYEMISLNVDNIITDNVELTQELVENWKEKISN